MPPARGGRGGGRGGRGGYSATRGTVTIAGTELNWDLSGLEIPRAPAEKFPAPPPTAYESATVQHFLTIRDRIHEGPFYTILNDGMKNGLKRKANEPVPTEASLFNPFSDNQTYSAKYLKVRRRVPKLDSRPYIVELFPPELRSYLESNPTDSTNKKRKVLPVSRLTTVSHIDRMIKQEQERANDAEARGIVPGEEEEEEEEDEDPRNDEEEKEEGDEDIDNWSAVSSDSEESGDDYNAEQYFDNGEDDDIDDADPYENTYE